MTSTPWQLLSSFSRVSQENSMKRHMRSLKNMKQLRKNKMYGFSSMQRNKLDKISLVPGTLYTTRIEWKTLVKATELLQ